jgi:lipoprotein-anchoring transpeptidase ErfK/SrfK
VNSVKNLLILAVLGAVGYGLYVSLARTNVETEPPSGVADFSPTGPKVELPGKPSSGGPLALSSSAPQRGAVPGAGQGGTTPPPFASSPAASPPAVTTLTPYPSSASTTAPSAVPPLGTASTAPAGPAATLGAPTSPDGIASATPPTAAGALVGPSSPLRDPTSGDAVRNLTPPSEVAVPSGVASSTANPSDSVVQNKFTAFMDAVQKNLAEGKLAEAHLALSSLYGNPDLPAEHARQITDLLDRLAGTVIYSRNLYLGPAYVTKQGDTLEKVAQRYDIPWQLLARINGMMPPGVSYDDNRAKDRPLSPGMPLKVVRGPFNALVRLDKHELTLTVQNRYAGRFRIGVGRDQPKLDGNYTVRDKALNPSYYGMDGVNISPNDPKNPLGGAWIGLTDRIGIHGTNDPQSLGRDDGRGAICVADRDLQDLYGILSVGSRVTIVR